MQSLITQSLGAIIDGLGAKLEECLVAEANGGIATSANAMGGVDSSASSPSGAPSSIHEEALRKKIAESALSLSRMAAFLRTCEALKVPTPSPSASTAGATSSGGIGELRTVAVAGGEAAKKRDGDALSSSRVAVPSYAARESLRRASKRLRGDGDEDDQLRSSKHYIMPCMRPMSLTEGLQLLMGPAEGAANPAANPEVVVRRGRKPEFNTFLGANVDEEQGTADNASVTPPPPPQLGHAVRFLRETQSADRSALLRFGHVPCLVAGKSASASGAAPTPPSASAVAVAASEYERLQLTAEAYLTSEYLTLVTLSQLQQEMPEIRERLGAAMGFGCGDGDQSPSSSSPSSSPVTVLRIQGGVASLSLRGLCVLNVWFNEKVRKWALVGFMWTVFDVSAWAGAAGKSEEEDTAAAAADTPTAASSSPPVLSLAHYAHQQIQKRIAMEVSTSLVGGLIAALRGCSGAVLQHIHNRLASTAPLPPTGTAAAGPSATFTMDGYVCRTKSDASRNASITVFCQPNSVAAAEGSDASVSASALPPRTVRLFFDHATAMLTKGTQTGTNIDAESKRYALDVLTLAGSGDGAASDASSASTDATKQQQLSYAVSQHVVMNMGRMAGLAVPSDEALMANANGERAQWEQVRKAASLPSTAGMPVALLSMSKILSPVQ